MRINHDDDHDDKEEDNLLQKKEQKRFIFVWTSKLLITGKKSRLASRGTQNSFAKVLSTSQREPIVENYSKTFNFSSHSTANNYHNGY